MVPTPATPGTPIPPTVPPKVSADVLVALYRSLTDAMLLVHQLQDAQANPTSNTSTPAGK
jgi:hypothetical protein